MPISCCDQDVPEGITICCFTNWQVLLLEGFYSTYVHLRICYWKVPHIFIEKQVAGSFVLYFYAVMLCNDNTGNFFDSKRIFFL
jgi:hypothetical protein